MWKIASGRLWGVLRVTFIVVMAVFGNFAGAQTFPPVSQGRLIAAEYYWDTDPGAGNGAAISIPGGETVITSDLLPLDLDITHLSTGVHTLGVRVKDASGRWGSVIANSVEILDYAGIIAGVTNAAVDDSKKYLVAAEYFWDSDPGVGKGTAVGITNGETLITPDLPPLNVDISGFSAGVHLLGFRVEDANGRWSAVTMNPIEIIEGNTVIAGVTNTTVDDSKKYLLAAEYFWDIDPGVGHATAVSVPTGETWTLSQSNALSLDISSLADGLHSLGVRTKDGSGGWSSATLLPVFISDPPQINPQPQSQIVQAGTSFSLSVSATGPSPYFYQWYQNGTNVLGATNSTYSLASAQFTNAGNYYVVVTNAFGVSTSATAQVAVSLGLPVVTEVTGGGNISVSPVSTDYTIGQTVSLTANAGRYYTFVQWSDGNTSVSRLISVGTSNFYTAMFTNSVPLESFVLKQWEQDFGGVGDDFCKSVIQTQDGGYLLGGSSASPVSGNKLSTNYGGSDVWIIKLDAYGNRQWEQTFGGTGSEEVGLGGLIQTPDGGYVMAAESTSSPGGNKTSANFGGYDFWVLRLDANGNKLWEKSYGGSGDEVFPAIQQMPDGGLILGGQSTSGANGSKTSPNYGTVDMWAVRTDANGNELWDQAYGGSASDGAESIQQTRDGGFIFSGYSDSGVSGNRNSSEIGPQDGWIVKVDGNGNKQWDSALNVGNYGLNLYSIQQTPNGAFFAGGYYLLSDGGSGRYVLFTLNSSGGELSSFIYGGSGAGDDRMYDLTPAQGGGFFLGGDSSSGIGGTKTAPLYGSHDYWIVKVDTNGNQLWDHSFGGAGDELFSSQQQTTDGGLILAGSSSSPASGNKSSGNFGGYDFWTVKLADVQQPVGTPIVLANGLYAISNNFIIPATNTIEVTLQSSYAGGFIFYTLDGSDPDFTATEYTNGSPFDVTNSLVVRAIAYNFDGSDFQEADPVAITVVPVYTLTNTTPGGGTVVFSPAGGFYLSNSVVTATATASNGWVFMGWSGVSSSTNNPLTVVMNGSTNLTAIFGTAITTNLPSGGSIALDPASGPYPYGSTVRLSGVPAVGKAFSRWFTFTGPTSNPLDFLVLSNNSVIIALFGNVAANSVTLTTLPSGPGTITRNPFANSYVSNAVVQIAAAPDAHNVFAGWNGAASGTQNPLSVTMNSNKVIMAAFTQPPVVSITSPVTGAGLTSANFSVAVSASDPDGQVAEVDLYVNGSIGGSLASAPYHFSLNNKPVGNYTLTAVATDNLGITATSAPVMVSVTNTMEAPVPPVVTLTSPANNSSFVNPATILISANASSSNGTIAQVVFYAGATRLATVTMQPYSFMWTNAPVASNVLTAVATDNLGLSSTSAPVAIVVNTSLPQVAILTPTNNSVFQASATITVGAVASDADNSIARVEFYSGNALLGSATNSPYQVVWTNVAVGTYALTAQAVDSYGPIVTSAPVNVSVIVPPSTNPAVFQFSAATYAVNESGGSITLTVTNTGGLGGSVNYKTSDGTAHGGTGFSGDYTKASGGLTFADHQTTSNISITILDNFLSRPDIQFQVQLSSPGTTNVVGNPGTAMVIIHENDLGGASNSLAEVRFPSAQPPTSGSLQVTLLPAEANGQWRFPWDLAWRNSGATVFGLQAGNYPVEFRNVSNYVAIPSIATVVVQANTLATYTNQYYPTLPPSKSVDTGSLTVNIPTNGLPVGAGWRFIGESVYRAPGSTVTNLVPDFYPVEFAPLMGFSKPASESVQIVGGVGVTITGNYQLASALPPGAVTPTVVSSESIGDYANFPYGYNGQLQTDVGLGSGVVVRPNIVLTAAHLVFDDATLAFVNNAYWFFEEEAGTFQPEPQIARGWFVLGGYAAQRTNDIEVQKLGIEQSSPQSRELDVAALYFVEQAGRTGWGGYLASDAIPNPYLTSSSALKMVVGYPVEGSAFGQTVTPGLMYTVPAGGASTPFAQDYGDTYTANWFISYPGNSGGPVYVQLNHGTYFPAGVYLGTIGSGTGSKSVVRAITSDVVNLINLAASEGDAGTNNAGGGTTTFVAFGVNPDNKAYVQVNLGPPAAMAAGASWRLSGDLSYGVNTAKGIYSRIITSSNVTVEFAPVSGWNVPMTVQTNFFAGPPQVYVLTANYTMAAQATLVADVTRGLGIMGTPGVAYRVEYRTNLSAGQWQLLKTNTLTAGFNPILPWPLTNGPAAFYRAVLMP